MTTHRTGRVRSMIGQTGWSCCDSPTGWWAAPVGLWLGLWLLVVVLVRWGSELGVADTSAAGRLSVIPVLIASWLTGTYLQIRSRLPVETRAGLRQAIALVVTLLFTLLMGMLGGWTSAGIAIITLSGTELLSRLLHDSEPAERAPAADGPVLDPTAPTAHPLSTVDSMAEDHGSHEEFKEQAESEIDEEALESGAGTAEVPADWLQQLTRTPSGIQWFCRHHWTPRQTQIDLHLPFEPAFANFPQVNFQLVEGPGQLSIGDLQPHGIRLQLKRSPAEAEDPAHATPASIVWLTVTQSPPSEH